MVKILYFLFLLQAALIDCSSFQSNLNRNEKLAEAVNPIVDFFIKLGYSTVRVDVGNGSNFEGLEIANEIIKKAKSIKILSRVLRSSKNIQAKRKSPVILILGSVSEFKLIEKLIADDNAKFYLVILLTGNSSDLNHIAKVFWRNLISNVNFLVSNSENFSILTFFPFISGRCGDQLELKTINSYSQKWTSKLFYPEKVHDLNKCEIKIAVNPSVPFTIVKIDNRTNSKIFDGIEVETIKTLSEVFNFLPSFEGPYDVIGAIYSNGSSNGLLALAHERKVDVVIGTLSLQIERLKYLSGTSFYMSNPTILTMPPTTKISPFKKLIMPFDLITWSLLIFMYTFGILIVTITRFASIAVYEFIVGKKVKNPILNMLIAFVGTTQHFLPRGTFSRFLLGKFLIFCLVMRGLYQGKLFHIMRSDLYEQNANTIDELIEKNFNFYTYESLSRRVQGFKFTER